MLWAITIAALCSLPFLLLVAIFFRSILSLIRPDREVLAARNALAAIQHLSDADAQKRAAHFLQSPQVSAQEEPNYDDQLLSNFGPHLRTLLTRYKSVQIPSMDAGIERPPNGLPNMHWPGHILLGPAGEHTWVLVRPGSDRIFIMPDDTDTFTTPEEEHPTIYHWLLQYEVLMNPRY